MKTHFVRLASLALLCGPFLTAQPADDAQLKQVIIFGRHGVRTPVLSNTGLGFPGLPPTSPHRSPGPPLGVAVLTPNGATDETILGGYFRLWLTQEGLLTGNDAADANFVYFRANGTPLITDTAKAFALGLLPAATVTVNSFTPPANDPLFDSGGRGRRAARLPDGGRGRERDASAAIHSRWPPPTPPSSPSRARFCSTIPPARLRSPRPRQVRSTSPPFPSPLRPEIPALPVRPRRAERCCCGHRSFRHGVRGWAAGFRGRLGPVDRRRHQPDLPLVRPSPRSGIPHALSG